MLAVRCDESESRGEDAGVDGDDASECNGLGGGRCPAGRTPELAREMSEEASESLRGALGSGANSGRYGS